MIEPSDQRFSPPPPPPPEGPGGGGNPWERRDRLGYGAGLLESIKLFVTSPSAAYDQTLKRGDFLSPLLFGVILGWFGAIIGQIWQFLFQGSILGLMGPEAREQFLPFLATTPLALVISMIMTPILVTIWLFIWSLIHHGSLMLVGALAQSDSGFEGTFRVNGYAQVVQLAAVVPLVGGLISIVWYLALQTIGVSRIHATTPGRALAGVLLPLVACCVCVGVFVALFWAMLASAFR